LVKARYCSRLRWREQTHQHLRSEACHCVGQGRERSECQSRSVCVALFSSPSYKGLSAGRDRATASSSVRLQLTGENQELPAQGSQATVSTGRSERPSGGMR
jgi:hypothetical protein